MRLPFMLNMIWRNKRQDTNVEKIYESERSKQTSNIRAFIHIPKLPFSLNISAGT